MTTLKSRRTGQDLRDHPLAPPIVHLRKGGARTACGQIIHARTVTDDPALTSCARCRETVWFTKRLGELNRAAVSTTSSPLPTAADLSESIRVLLMGGAPPWVQNVERRDEHTLCVLSEGRVFEVRVR
jgi:hypothetical protein